MPPLPLALHTMRSPSQLNDDMTINLLSFPHHNNVLFCQFLLPYRQLVTSLHQHLSLLCPCRVGKRLPGRKPRYRVEESPPGWDSACSLSLLLPMSPAMPHSPHWCPRTPLGVKLSDNGCFLVRGYCYVAVGTWAAGSPRGRTGLVG